MTLRPFDYPFAPHARVHGPRGYTDYQAYKQWLRDEFGFRCVYCLDRECWYPSGAAAFSVEHSETQSAAPERITDYENLLYACCLCNSFRRAEGLLDPTVDAFGAHLEVLADGSFSGLTAEGQRLVDGLSLNLPERMAGRLRFIRFAQLLEEPGTPAPIAELIRVYFGYPDDLPDLRRLRPPGGNARPEGVRACHAALRARGDLPAVY